jgi:hypothetical protein
MKYSALTFLILIYSTIALSQNKTMTDSLDGVIKKGFKKTLRMDFQTDSAYSSFYFKKDSKEVVEVIVTTREAETGYDFLNEQLVRVRMIVLNTPGNRTLWGKYYFLNTALVHTEETGMHTANPGELITQAEKLLKLGKARIK